jgi:hypothetical protein
VFERMQSNVDGALGNDQFARCEFRRLRKTNFALLRWAELLHNQFIEINLIVRIQYNIPLATSWSKKVRGSASSFMQELLRNELILEHRKAMVLGQGMRVDGVIGDLDHASTSTPSQAPHH